MIRRTGAGWAGNDITAPVSMVRSDARWLNLAVSGTLFFMRTRGPSIPLKLTYNARQRRIPTVGIKIKRRLLDLKPAAIVIDCIAPKTAFQGLQRATGKAEVKIEVRFCQCEAIAVYTQSSQF